MPKLMKASAWSAREFTPDSAPDTRTVRRWIERGVIRGRVVASVVYVFDTERFGVASEVSSVVDSLISGK